MEMVRKKIWLVKELTLAPVQVETMRWIAGWKALVFACMLRPLHAFRSNIFINKGLDLDLQYILNSLY